jgi:hypothetical protein
MYVVCIGHWGCCVVAFGLSVPENVVGTLFPALLAPTSIATTYHVQDKMQRRHQMLRSHKSLTDDRDREL